MNKNIYVFYGEESFLINREVNNIITTFFKEDSQNNVVKYDMLENNISDALEDISTMSLFSDKKIVICSNCYFLTGTSCDIEHDTDKLMKIIDSEIDNILILTVLNPKLDERKRIVKELSKKVNIKCLKI
jgi:DNA polymerase-3 subunit delta